MIPDVATDIIVQIIKNIIDNIGKTDENKNIHNIIGLKILVKRIEAWSKYPFSDNVEKFDAFVNTDNIKDWTKVKLNR